MKFLLALAAFSHHAVSLEPTYVSLIKDSITVHGSSYPRLSIVGTGPQWREVSGIGGLWVNRDDGLNIVYKNQLDEPAIVHVHGQTPPYNLDGVPYLSAVPLEPGRSAGYRYAMQPMNAGTYFAHSHYGFQHEKGMAMPFVVQAPVPSNYPLHRALTTATDVLMFLEDFGSYASTVGPKQNPTCFTPEVVFQTLQESWQEDQADWDFQNCMDPGKGSDVSFRAYLCNGRHFPTPRVQVVQPGGTYRVRIINAATMTNYQMRFPSSLNATLVATDGQYTKPLARNSLWVAVAQRLDVLITLPRDAVVGKTFPLLAVAEESADQTGLLLSVGTPYAPSPSNTSDTPAPTMGVLQELEMQAFFPLAPRVVDREFSVDLTGDNGFSAINGRSYQLPPMQPYSPNPHPLLVRYGDRVCITFTNYNADSHPMHLHGHSFQVVKINGRPVNGAMRDTVLVPRGECQTVKICFDADNDGLWPLHCHMTYHLMAGMLTTIEYEI